MNAPALPPRCAPALEAYVRRSSIAALGEPAAIVAGFIEARGGAALAAASEGASLRRALVRELLGFARELRSRARGGCDGCGCASPCEVPLDPDAFAAFEGAWAQAAMREAAARAERALVAEGDAVAWQAFRLHLFARKGYAEIAAGLALTAAEARARGARASARFERSLREVLADDGVPAGEADDELAWIIEAAGR